jgi:hypothetical protein
MNWQDDPQIQAAQAHHRARAALWRTALIWTPLFALSAVALLFFLVDELAGWGHGSWFLVVVLAVLSTLFGFQGLQSLIDLFAEPAEVTGEVTRRWSRTDSLVVRSHYIRIDKHIFRIDRDIHGDISQGDHVWVRYYPRSATVIEVEKRAPPEEQPAE